MDIWEGSYVRITLEHVEFPSSAMIKHSGRKGVVRDVGNFGCNIILEGEIVGRYFEYLYVEKINQVDMQSIFIALDKLEKKYRK